MPAGTIYPDTDRNRGAVDRLPGGFFDDRICSDHEMAGVLSPLRLRAVFLATLPNYRI